MPSIWPRCCCRGSWRARRAEVAADRQELRRRGRCVPALVCRAGPLPRRGPRSGQGFSSPTCLTAARSRPPRASASSACGGSPRGLRKRARLAATAARAQGAQARRQGRGLAHRRRATPTDQSLRRQGLSRPPRRGDRAADVRNRDARRGTHRPTLADIDLERGMVTVRRGEGGTGSPTPLRCGSVTAAKN